MSPGCCRLVAFVMATTPLVAAAQNGWSRFDLSTSGSCAELYLLPDLDRTVPAPVIVFLHGADDPNWFGGAGQRLINRLHALGVAVQLDLRSGYGHTTWPDESMMAGLEFLLAHPRPVAAPVPGAAAR